MDKKKILVVDDERDLLMLLGQRLSTAGYSVVKATNGNDAVRLAKEEKPDLILLDVLMPGMDGGDVAQILKSNPDTQNIPIMFLTCLYTKEDEAKKGHVIKDSFFIAKPYNPDELLSEIKKHLPDKK